MTKFTVEIRHDDGHIIEHKLSAKDAWAMFHGWVAAVRSGIATKSYQSMSILNAEGQLFAKYDRYHGAEFTAIRRTDNAKA